MFQIPPLDDLALAAAIVGALFLVRFLLAVRRVRLRSGRKGAETLWADMLKAREPLAFGRDFEPDRRYAVRQFYIGALFSAVGLALAGWLVASSVLTPFVERGLAV